MQPTQRQFLALAIPNTLAALAVPLAELVDIAFLGHLEDIGQLSGAVLAMVIFDYIFWCFGFLRMGATGLVAQAIGTDDREEQAALFWRGVLMAVFFGILLLLLQNPIAWASFSLLAGSAEIQEAARSYYRAHIWGSIPTLVNYACIGWLLGQQRSLYVFCISLVWQGTNIVLDYIFIMQLGWGAAGAGTAIMLAEWAGMLASIYFVRRCWGGFPAFDTSHICQWEQLRKLLTLNSSILLRTFLLISMLAAFTNISATFGSILLAANALLLRLWIMFAYVVDGFAIALESLAGKYSGSGDKAALRRALRLAMEWNFGITLCFMLGYGLAGDTVLALLTDHAEVRAEASSLTIWLLACLIAGGAAFILDGFFYGLAQPGILLRSMLVSIGIFALTALMAWHRQSPDLIWMAMLLMTVTRAATLWLPAWRHLEPRT